MHFHIDLILLDVMMPKMNGYEFTERLRSCGSMVPILMVTAKQPPEEKCKGFLVGTDDYMVKPVNKEELLLVFLGAFALYRFGFIDADRPAGIVLIMFDIIIRESREFLTVSFTNKGEPVPATALTHIFDKFYQADISHATQGNGLGLAIAQKIAKLHGGNITVPRSDAEGTIEHRPGTRQKYKGRCSLSVHVLKACF